MKSKIIVLTHPSGKTVKLKLGFSWPAFFLSPLWSLFKHMWLNFFALFAVILVISFIDGYAENTKNMPLTIFVLFLYIAYLVVCGKYGNYWLKASLLKRGYQLEGSVDVNA